MPTLRRTADEAKANLKKLAGRGLCADDIRDHPDSASVYAGYVRVSYIDDWANHFPVRDITEEIGFNDAYRSIRRVDPYR